ncbi:hypothetical protein AVEN_60137-1 [Araneus ventricosus]|uniref:Uncharacterized protein n=1 Tax=Araneus ventricosus TaxID=182803 RepID=A0A4Y2HXR2_ARAVE|nr:hypothetical protein AVEN_60137-1 [Araneus ventricosus]
MKSGKQPKPTIEIQNQSNSEFFWRTLSLQLSTSASMQIDNSHSTGTANDLKITDETKYPPVNSVSEPMPIDSISNNKTDDEIESSAIEDAIYYDPNETIKETSPFVEQQQSVTNPNIF